MTDLYIATPTQADYDALMRLAEAKGYVWGGGNKPTHYKSREFGRETVIHLFSNNQKTLTYTRKVSCDRDGCTVKTIPNLADIKAIWKVQPDDHKAFFKGKSYKHPLPSDESVIMLEMTDELVEGLMDIHKALAVEYKSKESEKVMNEKVKLPKFMCDWLDQHKEEFCSYPMTDITTLNRERDTVGDVRIWLLSDTTNQWKLIDALHYGYEVEPEPRWGVKVGNCYLSSVFSIGKTVFMKTLNDACYWEDKSVADFQVEQLGFGVVVDLNKEDKADEPESEQLYYVRFIQNNSRSFLNSSDSNGLEISDNEETEYIKTKFTMSEILAIDPRYKAFVVPVDEVDGDMNKEDKADD